MNLLRLLACPLPYGIVEAGASVRSMAKLLKHRLRGRWVHPERNHAECLIVLNGPSVNDIREDIVSRSKDMDVMTVNLALGSDLFYALRPTRHIICDPDFFFPDRNPDYKHLTVRFFETLNSLDWDMTLLFPHKYYRYAKKWTLDPHISLVTFPNADYTRTRPRTAALIPSGISGFGTRNVACAALYLAIVAGYERIYIGGLDLNLKYRVSRTCLFEEVMDHFYKDEEDGTVNKNRIRYPVGQFYEEMAEVYRQLYTIADYARSRGIEIVNLSEESMVDAFPKGKLDGTVYPFRDIQPERPSP